MKLHDLFIRSGDNLQSAMLRTLLTTLAIGVGAFAMAIGIALNQGGGSYADKILTANIDAHSLWVVKKEDDRGTTLYPSQYSGSNAIRFNKVSVTQMDDDNLNAIRAVPGVTSVEPVYVIDQAIITRQSQKQYQAVVNVARDGAYRVYIAGDSGHLKQNEIVLSDGYRQALGFSSPEESIGKTVSLSVWSDNSPTKKKTTLSYTVRAVIKQSTLSLSVAPMAVLVSVDAAKTLNADITDGTPSQGKFIASNASIDPSEDLETVKQKIIDAGYLAQTPGDVYSAMYQFVGVLRFVLIMFGIIAVLTAVFGIINTQYISVLERVQEIGLMKALGMSGKSVSKLIQIEAGLIGFIGSCFGTLAALGIGSALNPWTSSFLTFDPDTNLMIFSVGGTVGVVVLLSIVSLIAGLMPARMAAALDPIDALRNDNL